MVQGIMDYPDVDRALAWPDAAAWIKTLCANRLELKYLAFRTRAPVEVDAVISARTPAVTTGGAPRRHAGARLGHDGAGDGGGGLDDLALHNFT